MANLSKIFSSEKLVDGKVLNLLGIQVFRTLLARAIYSGRYLFHRVEYKYESDKLRQDGVLVIPDFMSAEKFEELRRRCVEIIESQKPDVDKETHGSNHTEYWSISPDSPTTATLAELISKHTCVLGILKDAELREFHPLDFCAIEKLSQGSSSHEHDPETDLHSDTFFVTHKAWLYLSDADEKNGYLKYVKRSNRLFMKQLVSVYKHGLVQRPRSRRIDERELACLERRGMKEVSLKCQRNTLVISNTCGYHRRTAGIPGENRLAIFFMLRANPFALSGPSKPVRP